MCWFLESPPSYVIGIILHSIAGCIWSSLEFHWRYILVRLGNCPVMSGKCDCSLPKMWMKIYDFLGQHHMGDILRSWQNHQDDKPGCRTIWAGAFGSWKFGKPNKNLQKKMVLNFEPLKMPGWPSIVGIWWCNDVFYGVLPWKIVV